MYCEIKVCVKGVAIKVQSNNHLFLTVANQAHDKIQGKWLFLAFNVWLMVHYVLFSIFNRTSTFSLVASLTIHTAKQFMVTCFIVEVWMERRGIWDWEVLMVILSQFLFIPYNMNLWPLIWRWFLWEVTRFFMEKNKK